MEINTMFLTLSFSLRIKKKKKRKHFTNLPNKNKNENDSSTWNVFFFCSKCEKIISIIFLNKHILLKGLQHILKNSNLYHEMVETSFQLMNNVEFI